MCSGSFWKLLSPSPNPSPIRPNPKPKELPKHNVQMGLGLTLKSPGVVQHDQGEGSFLNSLFFLGDGPVPYFGLDPRSRFALCLEILSL